jgi:hypothetical protein
MQVMQVAYAGSAATSASLARMHILLNLMTLLT